MKTINFFHKLVLCNLALCVICSCVTDVANRYYLDKQLLPNNPKNVEILYSKPKREFIVIADFQSRGETPEAIRKKAAKIGADAVIVSILGGLYYTGEEWAGNDRFSSTYTRITGTAIKYK